MNRVMLALLASLFATVDAIRDHLGMTSGNDKPDGTELGPMVPYRPLDPEPEPEAAQPRRTRKRGRGRRSMVVYRVVKGAKTAKALGDRSTLQPTEIDVLRAVKEAGSISAFDIEKATGHGKKSVESAVWRLRKEHNLIESVRNGD